MLSTSLHPTPPQTPQTTQLRAGRWRTAGALSCSLCLVALAACEPRKAAPKQRPPAKTSGRRGEEASRAARALASEHVAAVALANAKGRALDPAEARQAAITLAATTLRDSALRRALAANADALALALVGRYVNAHESDTAGETSRPGEDPEGDGEGDGEEGGAGVVEDMLDVTREEHADGVRLHVHLVARDAPMRGCALRGVGTPHPDREDTFVIPIVTPGQAPGARAGRDMGRASARRVCTLLLRATAKTIEFADVGSVCQNTRCPGSTGVHGQEFARSSRAPIPANDPIPSLDDPDTE